MIHSLSGGVLSDGESRLFVKVIAEGTPCWYLSPDLTVTAGDEVLVPFGRGTAQGRVERTMFADGKTSPVPLSRAKEICQVVKRAKKT